MQQLTQKLKNGNMKVTEVPWPMLGAGMVLVRNYYSLISAGTEGSTVKAARKSLIGKALERPQQIKQALDVLKTQGVIQTFRTVMKKLESLSPLGYSCVGEIIGLAPDVTQFKMGDMVACGGLSANHAEVVAVPMNLCVKVTQNEMIGNERHLKMAAYNTLGAIAMQGVRQADLRLGETCAVIGLGLLGQLTCQLLRASGVKVVGIDIDESAVTTAKEHSADLALIQSGSGIVQKIESFSDGVGVDAVIITAASSSHGPINFAGEICRKKGRVVIVGDVPTGFDRDPHYYRKELEVRMSCSYGPGRYDINYEEKGVDYPPAYIRWTENRNMAAFQELIRNGSIDISYLTTHEFALEDAPKAYDMIIDKSEPFLGILIRYNFDKPIKNEQIRVSQALPTGQVALAFIGAGNYAQGNLLPNLPKDDPSVINKSVMTASGTTSKGVAERFGFEACTSNKDEIFNDTDINTVFITTRHNTHASFVLDSLRAGKHVFVEKPLCLTIEEQAEIEATYAMPECDSSILMVGFNRRFSPLARILKEKFNNGPMAMVYRINAGAIPADSWIQDSDIGGGRIVGEVCHFVDFMTFMCGALPMRVYASAMSDPQNLNDTVAINIEFDNGSVGTIAYYANGSKSLAKEYFEVYKDGVTGSIKDFRELEISGSGKPFRKKLSGQDKGQKKMIEVFIQSIKEGKKSPITPQEIFAVTRATFGIEESLHLRQTVQIISD